MTDGDVAPGAAPTVGAAVVVVDALRERDAWYAAQTHASLARYAVEEGHEVAAEALDAAAPTDALRDELGDLLLQVVLHARLASERAGGFDLDDVAAALVAKARRRHPHVFAAPAGGDDDGNGPTVAELEAGWASLKDAERGGRDPLDDLPASLPALVRAQKVLALAERSGVAAPPAPPPRDPSPPCLSSPAATDPAGVGADLLALAERARCAGLDAESELRTAVAALEARTRAARPAAPAAPAALDRGA